MGKRGRKPSKDNDKIYFGIEQEHAVVDYLNATTKEEKDYIFNAMLKNPFKKMIESIIRRYGLYIPDEISGDTFDDVESFLITRMDNFKPAKNRKAYSYYGTICKNHLIQRIKNMTKEAERNPSYDTLSNNLINNGKYVNGLEYGEDIASEAMNEMVELIDRMVEHPDKYSLKESEIKMGKALKNVLVNWDYVLTTDGSNKLNKNAILLFLRETTGFDTKGIRDNMKKYKREYWNIKKKLIE